MQKFLLKTMLVAGACLVGANYASADATVIYERGGSGTAWSDDDLTEWVESNTQYVTPTIEDNALVQSLTNGDFSVTKTFDVANTSIVTMTATINGGCATGRGGSYDYITIGGVTLRLYGQDKKATVDIEGNETDLSGFTRDASYTINVTIDQANNTASYTVSGSATGNADDVVCTTKFTEVKVGHYKAGRENYAATVKLNSIEVAEQTQAVVEGSYTINYVCDGVSIKESTQGTGTVGNIVPVSHDPIWFEDEKYIYVSDNAEENPISATGAVVTVEYAKAKTLAYTFESSVGDWRVTGSTYEGENVTVDYPRFVIEGTTAYIVSGINWSKNNIQYAKTATITEDNQVIIINYEFFANDVVFFAEGEDIYSTAYNGAPTRTSCGKAGLIDGEVEITTLEPGSYKIYAASHCASSSTGAIVTFKVGDETILTQEPKGWLALEYEGKDFEVTAAGALTVSYEGASAGLDYIMVTGKTLTGIADIEAADDNSFDCYNLNGQRVLNPTKGLYIINGKKVLK